HVPNKILNGKEWRTYKSKDWGDGNLAYLMEQKVLDILEINHTVHGEIVYCDRKALTSAWNKAISSIKPTNP
ncbi:hypothetical protein, partial [Candidatus Puniceispirillum sp.]|uniref:hypothetical protein n=1 Tax=Candidatus Puniceispirillum sp. TaxID=2026719 RepID=UPI003F6A40E9